VGDGKQATSCIVFASWWWDNATSWGQRAPGNGGKLKCYCKQNKETIRHYCNKVVLAIIQQDPYQTPPPYEKPVGDLSGAYSCRINIQHSLLYQIYHKQ
jgi:Txe/YoeB family toxin of toxin-antitoxin system